MADTILTKSKTISLDGTNYALLFVDIDDISTKANHKNKKSIRVNGEFLPRDFLDMESRVVDLEGAMHQHMFCLGQNSKYKDYKDCMFS